MQYKYPELAATEDNKTNDKAWEQLTQGIYFLEDPGIEEEEELELAHIVSTFNKKILLEYIHDGPTQMYRYLVLAACRKLQMQTMA